VFEITRIPDADTRTLDLVRLRAPTDAQLALVSPNAPPPPPVAPTPALSILDLPLLPGAEDDERPLAAVFASPWLGSLEVDAGVSTVLATKRAAASQPATMGELLWALWPGPVDWVGQQQRRPHQALWRRHFERVRGGRVERRQCVRD
jgi:hypothetical protein